MEDEQIEAMKNWPEPTSVKDIQVFIGFANFYWRFIWGFSRIAIPPNSMLKTNRSFNNSAPKGFRADGNKVDSSGSKANKTVVNSSKSKKYKNEKSENLTYIKATGELIFLTPGTKKTFNRLKQAFIEAPILRYFDLKCYIRIETDVSSYAIG